jgi:hypothetical protein
MFWDVCRKPKWLQSQINTFTNPKAIISDQKKTFKRKKNENIPVRGCEDPQGWETLRLSIF